MYVCKISSLKVKGHHNDRFFLQPTFLQATSFSVSKLGAVIQSSLIHTDAKVKQWNLGNSNYERVNRPRGGLGSSR